MGEVDDTPPGLLAAWLHRRARRKQYAYHPGFRGPAGLKFLGGTNHGAVTLMSRHPRWSITWLWSVQWKSGSERGGGKLWEKRWGVSLMPRIGANALRSPLVVALGRFGTLSVNWQRAMPYGPGDRNYSRRHHTAYARRWAAVRARHAYDREFRATFARMMNL